MIGAVQTLLEMPEAGAPAAVVEVRSTAAPIELTLHGNLDDIEHIWRDFETRADCTAFQSFAWQSAWFAAIGRAKGVKPVIVVGRRDGGVLFLFPLAVEALGALRRLTWLGSALCDYNVPLLAPEFSAAVPADAFAGLWERIRQALRDRNIAYDVVDLEKMPELCGAQPNPFARLPAGLNPSHAYATQLAGDWEAFYSAKRSAATRRRDRTKRKRMSEHGELSFLTAADHAAIERTLGVLMEQKVASLSAMGAANIFAPPGHAQFYRDLAADPRNRDIVHVSRLDVGATPVAANLGLVFRGSYYHVLASHGGGSELTRFGPGVAHLHELMKYAIGRELQIFDFTIGDEAYKREWCDSELELYDHVAAASLKGWFAVPALLAARRAKRALKQSPALWRAFSRAREILAAWRRSGSRAAP